jgi:LPXTG-motif cell wall-anchored protein
MKMRPVLVAVIAGLLLLVAGAARAQDLPDLPGIDPAKTQIADAPRTPRNPAASLPARNFLPGEIGRAPAAAAAGTGAPTRLPETGVDTTSLALDGLTLLGAGLLFLTIRRRLAGV